MPTPYTSPTKLTTSVLVHIGDFQVNQVDGGVTPPEYVLTTDSVAVTTSFVTHDFSDPPFTHFDAAVTQAANYDEIVVDVQPLVTWNSSVDAANVITADSMTDYRQIAASGRPFWLIVRLDGYGVSALYGSATDAVDTAVAVATRLIGDVSNYHMSSQFRGIAFLRPDLNVVYSDGSAITRFQQNQLVQFCWQNGLSACMITARPADILSLISPVLTSNPNSGVPLDNPIIGCNVAQPDKVLILYPAISKIGQNISVVIGQISATQSSNNRDPGFTPLIDFAYVIPMDDSFWTADGTGGVTGYSGVEAQLANIANFCAAMGITDFGLYGITSASLGVTGYNFPAPNVFLPADANVNTTGSSLTWGSDSYVYVAYAAPAGSTPSTITRKFNASFVETVPYVGPPYP